MIILLYYYPGLMENLPARKFSLIYQSKRAAYINSHVTFQSVSMFSLPL